MKVEIDAAYDNGHEYKRTVVVDEPRVFPSIADETWWEEWWWENVFPHTGDNQPGDANEYAECKIVSAVNQTLVGMTHDFGG